MAKVGKAHAAAKANASKKTEKKKAAKKNENLFEGTKKAAKTVKANKAAFQEQIAVRAAENNAAKNRAQEAKNKTKNNNAKINVKAKENQVVKTHKNGKKIVETVNKNGKVISKEVTVGKGKNKKTITTDFDKNGNKTSRVTTTGKGDDKVTQNVKYENNKKTEITTTGKVDGKKASVTKQFDENGNVIQKTITTGKGKNAQTTTINFEYGKNGNLIRKTQKDNLGTVKDTIYDNYADKKKGKQSRTATVTITDANGKQKQYIENQVINKDNKLTSAKRYNADGNLIRAQRKKYDKNGDVKESVTTRYYQDGSTKTVKYTDFEKSFGSTSFDVRVRTKSKDDVVKIYEGKGNKYFSGLTSEKAAKVKKTFAASIMGKIASSIKNTVGDFVEKFNGLNEKEQEELEEFAHSEQVKAEKNAEQEIKELENEMVLKEEVQMHKEQQANNYLLDVMEHNSSSSFLTDSAGIANADKEDTQGIAEFIQTEYSNAKSGQNGKIKSGFDVENWFA